MSPPRRRPNRHQRPPTAPCKPPAVPIPTPPSPRSARRASRPAPRCRHAPSLGPRPLVYPEAPPHRRFLPGGGRDVRGPGGSARAAGVWRSGAVTSGEEGKRTGARRRGSPPRWRTRFRCTRCRVAPSGERPITPAPLRRRDTTGTSRGGTAASSFFFPPSSRTAGRAACALRPAPLPCGASGPPTWSVGRPRCRPRSGVSAAHGSSRPPQSWPPSRPP